MSRYPEKLTDDFFTMGLVAPTSRCTASCYMCDGINLRNYPKNVDLSLNAWDKIIPYAKSYCLTGCAGDMIYHPQSLEMLERIQDKPFTFETNGSIQGEDYWKELAKLASTDEQYVQFAIDDIESEFNPYRKLRTETILNNFKIFTEAGGKASIKVILFEFNENQIEKMKEYFKDHQIYYSYSCDYNEEYPPPSNIPKIFNGGTRAITTSPDIDYNRFKSNFKVCPWVRDKRFYVIENGEVHLCSYNCIFNSTFDEHYPKEMFNEVFDLYNANRELINLNNVSFEDAWYNEYTQYLIHNFMNISRCQRRCYFTDKLNINVNKFREF